MYSTKDEDIDSATNQLTKTYDEFTTERNVERGPSSATSHPELRNSNRRDDGQQYARSPSVGGEVGYKTSFPNLLESLRAIPHHVHERGLFSKPNLIRTYLCSRVRQER